MALPPVTCLAIRQSMRIDHIGLTLSRPDPRWTGIGPVLAFQSITSPDAGTPWR